MNNLFTTHPNSIAIVAMGETRRIFENSIMSLKHQKLVDQVWVGNLMAIMLDPVWYDVIWMMDDIPEKMEPVLSTEQLTALKAKPRPIITSTAYPEWPTTVEYPVKDVLRKLGTACIPDTTTAWAMAYAIYRFATDRSHGHIKLYGTDFNLWHVPEMIKDYQRQTDTEIAIRGRSCMTYLIGLALGLGMEVQLPDQSDLLGGASFRANPKFYGYRDGYDVAGLFKQMLQEQEEQNVS